MKKYKLQVYGWEMNAIGYSITNDQVENIQNLIKDNGYDELLECRWDLEDEGIVDSSSNPYIFDISRALNNGKLVLRLYEEGVDNPILEFDQKEMYEYDNLDDQYPYESYLAIPEEMDNVDNVMIIIDENKGGIVELLFESDEIPTAKDFNYLSGDIETPDGEFDFISGYLYKGKLLDVHNYLDNSGKSSSMVIYTKDGDIIN